MLQQLLLAEIERRLQVLPAEVQRWRDAAQANAGGMGIHRSQIQALHEMFAELSSRQRGLALQLAAAPDASAFVQIRADLERELCGAHGLLAVFRLMMAQRDDASYRRALDVADLVAADCYSLFTGTARRWGVLPESRLREPPLCFLNALYSPAAFTRRHSFGAFKMPLGGYSELKLPLSILSLPFGHTATAWMFCALYHEVGHAVDQDLALSEALAAPLAARLEAAGAPTGERAVWRTWLREMVADACGVLLGGGAFVRAMVPILWLPPAQVLEVAPDPHPNPFVRVFLLGALLRRSAWPQASDTADSIEGEWEALYPTGRGKAELATLISRADVVATAVLEEPLQVLAGHALRDSGAGARDDAHVARLAHFLREGTHRPDPESSGTPVRLVPAAAQAALNGVSEGFGDAASAIHDRALAFALAVPRPNFLPGAQDERREFLRQIARDLDFSKMED